MAHLRVRRSFRDIEEEHYLHVKKGEKGPTQLDKLIRAFHHICVDTAPENLNSFFTIGGYHGEPFRGAGWGNSMWWGGYCYHGQILFPTWHRAYCMRLEDALRTAPGCSDVTLPFLDWCEDRTRTSGLPDTFQQATFIYSDGKSIANPLYNYKFQKSVFDNVPASIAQGNYDYTKLKDYKTVRYPYSGLVGGSKEQAEVTAKWNAQEIFKNGGDKKLLNDNIVNWLSSGQALNPQDPKPPAKVYQGVYDKFRNCLAAPNFTVFSNTTSAQQYNQEKLNQEQPHPPNPNELTIPLESPHNAMHLATGGFTSPNDPATATTVNGANGDMGENNTAGLDPIFFFHHCYIDRMFYLWQQRHNQTEKLIIEPEYAMYPGTNNMDSQGPVAGAAAGEQLTLSTPLTPFKKADGTYMNSYDVVDIHKMGYTYGPGSFDSYHSPQKHISFRDEPHAPKTHVSISGISRSNVRGSFVVHMYHKGELVAAEPILSRNRVDGCANCQAHLNVKTFAPLLNVTRDTYQREDIEVKLHTHKGLEEEAAVPNSSLHFEPIYHG